MNTFWKKTFDVVQNKEKSSTGVLEVTNRTLQDYNKLFMNPKRMHCQAAIELSADIYSRASVLLLQSLTMQYVIIVIRGMVLNLHVKFVHTIGHRLIDIINFYISVDVASN